MHKNTVLNQASYNTIALDWAASRNKSFVSQLVIDFADRITPNGKILDVGCGTAYPLAAYLAERGFKITGIDVAEKMIEIAQSLFLKEAEFQVCDFFEFQSPAAFDGILAWDSFFHFPKESQAAIYTKVSELLLPNGYLLFTHGNGDDEKTDEMMGAPFYYSCLPLNQVVECLNDGGLEVVYALQHYVERSTDRDLVVLAKKK
jgi:2-polyprenyl-3-methyl-5-hydroxy-6-metoxy-1,4-benzoquinol methylase